MRAGSAFVRRILLRQTLVSSASFCIVALFAQKLVVLDWEVTLSVFEAGAWLALLAIAGTFTLSLIRLTAQRALAPEIGSPAVKPEGLARLAEIPSALTYRFLFVSSISASLILVPGIRPALLDDGRAVSLLILTVTILGASAIPHYFLVRAVTTEIMERSALEPLSALLEGLELQGLPWRRITEKMLMAVVVPVALMGVGAVLVSHAHLRTLTEQSKKTTALLVARTALESGPGGESARDAAMGAAAQLGFVSRLEHTSQTSQTFAREPDGELSLTVPVDDGQVILRFSGDLRPGDTSAGAGITLLAVAVAALLGGLFGRGLADDLVLATRSVRLLGTESVIRGGTQIARPARFAVVADLARAIEGLTDRFRVFAAAQERAIEARLAAQRMRGLLFASVSHDLKSPLNAILGFAELLADEDLTAAQRESLDLIAQRGRELLALIETILDAARVEAGQLKLLPKDIEVSALLSEAVKKARELASDGEAPILVEIAEDLGAVPLDAAYGPRAIAVIIAHALRTAAADPSGRVVRVRATDDGDLGVRIDVEYGSRDVPSEELEALFARQATSRGRGLTLGLSLARSVIELHGGRVDVDRAPDGAPVCRAQLRREPPGERPRLSSVPALG
jgi:signal transduction histidine kinase